MNDFPTTTRMQFLFVTMASVRMRLAGLEIAEITDRLHELGFQPSFTQGLAEVLPEYQTKSRSDRVPGAPRVFLSHSHLDRQQASYIEGILERNGVQTFLDQHRITPGENLENRLLVGLFWCDFPTRIASWSSIYGTNDTRGVGEFELSPS